MRGTALLYSSHDRCNTIHNDLIAQRALAGNKRILFLPMSSGSDSDQRGAWEGFRWFFDQYKQFGLDAFPFYWSDGLQKSDVEQLWNHLWGAEVVILGGGNPGTGLWRYKQLGERYDGEWGKFGRILHERQQRGLLTAGFSAGADQLSEYLYRQVWGSPYDSKAFGLARNVLVTLHHEAHMNGNLWEGAKKFPHCRVFGLPNDAALYLDQGVLPSGNHWQVIEFVLDTSWDKPQDAWHIKTRQGAMIEHIYADGRHWAFRNGDKLVRITSTDNRYDEAFVQKDGQLWHYGSQQLSPYHNSVEDVLAKH